MVSVGASRCTARFPGFVSIEAMGDTTQVHPLRAQASICVVLLNRFRACRRNDSKFHPAVERVAIVVLASAHEILSRTDSIRDSTLRQWWFDHLELIFDITGTQR